MEVKGVLQVLSPVVQYFEGRKNTCFCKKNLQFYYITQ